MKEEALEPAEGVLAAPLGERGERASDMAVEGGQEREKSRAASQL